ncbi:MAG: winged helix-turn-helix domain-containing protein [Tabrizicola sp.]|jgi:DNA-binding winged helix-turn-helix (wHTH) protein|nr:winged helix-turn-helix domain-containing protein [Tabrizicola sp.]
MTPQIIAFGDFTLDLAQGRLFSRDGDVRLRAKSFQLLSALAREGGRVVSKDHLMAEVWPDVFVTEDSLTQCVHEIRHALGPEGAGFLRTVPRRGYMLAGPGVGMAVGGQDDAPVAPNSIAVMPFLQPEGMDPRNRVLFDGLTHDVISRLARLRDYRVTGRGSAFALRAFAEDAARLRQLLRVAYVVTGRVTPVAGRQEFRLVIDVVRTSDGSLEWVDEVPVAMSELDELSAVTASQIVLAISVALSEAEKRRVLGGTSSGIEAWELFHRGLDSAFRFTSEGMRSGMGFLNAATELDPKSARAHAYLSFCKFYFAFTGQLGDRQTGAGLALESASRAMEADALHPVAQWAYGRALWLAGDPALAKDHVAQAVALCPSFPNAHYMLGFIECYHGSAVEALRHLATSEAQSPFDPFLAAIQLTRATACLRIGDLDAAADWAARAILHSTAYGQMLYHAALIQDAAGRHDEARTTMTKLGVRDPGYDFHRYFSSLYGLPDDLSAGLLESKARLAG